MRVPILIGVGLLLITSASWLARADPQRGGHRGGGGAAPQARPQHPPRAAGGAQRPSMPKPKAQHPPKAAAGAQKSAPPKAKAQHSPKAASGAQKSAKKGQAEKKEKAEAKKREEKKELAEKKAEAKKREERKELAEKKERAEAKKREERKELARKEAMKKAREVGGGRDPESISLLHAAHRKLREADHDYGGHRVRALEHVGAALGHLGSSAPAGPAGTGRGTMPQSVSDGILRESRATLETIRNRLGAMRAAAAAHGHARGAVDAAIREIDLALTVR
jgi:DNA polymerase III gamma/tau subunit